jgi:hypothetical protein
MRRILVVKMKQKNSKSECKDVIKYKLPEPMPTYIPETKKRNLIIKIQFYSKL